MHECASQVILHGQNKYIDKFEKLLKSAVYEFLTLFDSIWYEFGVSQTWNSMFLKSETVYLLSYYNDRK